MKNMIGVINKIFFEGININALRAVYLMILNGKGGRNENT